MSILAHLYGEAITDGLAVIGQRLLARGLDGHDNALDVANVASALAEPATYRELADLVDELDMDGAQPTVLFAASTTPDARRFAELLPLLREQLRALLNAAGRPSTDEDVERLTRQVLAGRKWPVLRLLWRGARRGKLPAPDAALTVELQEMHRRLQDGWRDGLARETLDELRSASAAEGLDVLESLRRRRSA